MNHGLEVQVLGWFFEIPVPAVYFRFDLIEDLWPPFPSQKQVGVQLLAKDLSDRLNRD